MDPIVNKDQWTSAEVEEARLLIARLTSIQGGISGDGNKKHNSIFDELQAWFPLKTTQQVTDLYVELVVEMQMAQWRQQEAESRLHHAAATGGSSDSTSAGGRGAFAMSDLVKDNFGVPEEEAAMGGGDAMVFGFPSEEMRYVEAEEVPPAVAEETKSANHQQVVASCTGRFWTTKEHRSFLRGLRAYGRGNWKNISKHFVPTRTPIQVSSHAQKYFRRQEISRGAVGRQRYSINDVRLSDDDPWAPATATENSRFTAGGSWQALAFAGGAVHHAPSFGMRAPAAPAVSPPPPPFVRIDDVAQLWSPLIYRQLQRSEQQRMASAPAPTEGAGKFVPPVSRPKGPAAAPARQPPADQWMMNNNNMMQ